MKKILVVMLCLSVLILGLSAGDKKDTKKVDKGANGAFTYYGKTGQDPFAPVPPDKLYPIVKELRDLFKIKKVRKAYHKAIKNVKGFPGDGIIKPFKNIWENRSCDEFCYYFHHWLYFLATPTKEGLGFIEPFTHLYYDNPKAFHFLNTLKVDGKKVIFNWTVKFIETRGAFMDKKNDKDVLEAINEWVKDPNTHIEDYIMPGSGYKTFNDFFSRELRPGARPIADVGDDSVVVSPADSVINMINTKLTKDSGIPLKANKKIGVKALLNHHPSWKKFIGGTALSCVLLPADYHHYHAPVTGKLVHYEEVNGIYNGIPDAPEWFHDGNVGASDANFSIFELFHRGVFIFETDEFGYVAMVAVGLNTISRIEFEMKSVNTIEKYKKASIEKPVWVPKGTKLGGFKYGGSLNILLFEPGVYSAHSVHQGQRIGGMVPRSREAQ